MRGEHKLLLPFPDQPLVRCAAEAALASAVGPLAVVVDSEASPVVEALAGLPLATIANPDADCGISTSIDHAAAWGLARAQALVLVLADEPEMSPEVIREAVARWRERRPPALRAVYRDRVGHPVIVTSAFMDRADLSGDRGLGRTLRSRDVETYVVDEDAPADIDTETAYREALARLTH